MICLPVTSKSADQALHDIQRACLAADAVELRMDLIAGGTLAELISTARKTSDRVKIIVTCRRPEEAASVGRLPVVYTAEERMVLLKKAVDLEADYVDIELACGDDVVRELLAYCCGRGGRTKVIVSFHDIKKTPSLLRLKEIFHRSRALQADVVKIVTFAVKPEDNLKILALIPYARKYSQKIIALGMGEKGRISRIAAPHLGNFLSFATLENSAASAPGQLTLTEMKQIVRRTAGNGSGENAFLTSAGDSRPVNFVLLGNPVAQSLSPFMHNTALAGLGIGGNYSAFCVVDLASAVQGIRGMNIRGASVTLPFKSAVMEYLDDVSPDGLAIGAVNTIYNDNGCLAGFNTDFKGLIMTIREGLEIRGKKFVIIGAGGTARAAVYGIIKEGGSPVIVNRTPEQGYLLAKKFGCPFYALSEIDKIKADCLINTTPVGMYPAVAESPVSASVLTGYEYVVDVIYNPLKTRLLQDAEKAGCRIFSGLNMFVHQGAEQIKLWTGKEPDRALMKMTVLEKLKRVE